MSSRVGPDNIVLVPVSIVVSRRTSSGECASKDKTVGNRRSQSFLSNVSMICTAWSFPRCPFSSKSRITDVTPVGNWMAPTARILDGN